MGRHGGINILHQKSWHVWRMDNRLRVERDELQHAAEEKDRKSREAKAAFDAKVAKLRRRATGEVEAEQPLAQLHVPSTSSTAGTADETRGQRKGDDYHVKYGVTLSNLKQAESFLDQSLKHRRQGKREDTANYWGTGGLGSGPHINLFEEAELETSRHIAEHSKLLRYADTNNKLAEKSKKKPLSEFDEIASDVPWYAQASRPLPTGSDDAAGVDDVLVSACSSSRSRSRSKTLRRWRKRHGQTLLQVMPKEEKSEAKVEMKCEEKEDMEKEKMVLVKEDEDHIAGSASDGSEQACAALCAKIDTGKQSKTAKIEKRKKENGKKDNKESNKGTDKKAKKEDRRAERRQRERQELEELRRQRQLREEAERRRAATLLAAG